MMKAYTMTNEDLIQELAIQCSTDSVTQAVVEEAVLLLEALQKRAPELVQAVDRHSGEVDAGALPVLIE